MHLNALTIIISTLFAQKALVFNTLSAHPPTLPTPLRPKGGPVPEAGL